MGPNLLILDNLSRAMLKAGVNQSLHISQSSAQALLFSGPAAAHFHSTTVS